MKTVFDFAPFKEAADLMAELMAEADALRLEHQDILQKLAFSASAIQGDSLTAPEAARRILNGTPPMNATEATKALQERELFIRTRLEALDRTLKTMPPYLELMRQKARDARRKELSKEFQAVEKASQKAEQVMADACRQEDALIREMVEGGFGASDPVITAPVWLNRDLFRLNVQ